MRYLAAIVGCGALMLGARLNPAPPVDMGRPVALDSIRMITPLVGWATTAGAIVRTVDGGRDWTPLPLPGHAAVGSAAPQFLDTRTAWVAADHPDGTMTLQVTHDGGRVWLFGGLVIGASFPHQLVFLDARHGWLFVGGGGMHSNGLALYRTVDGGRHWEKAPTRLPISGLLGFATPTTGWATDEHAGGAPACPRTISVISPGALYVTRDGGRSWSLQRLPIPPGYCASILSFTPGSLPGQLVFSTPRDGLLPVNFSMSGSRPPALVVYDTHDGGHTWQATPPLALPVVLTDFLDARDGWAVATEGPRTGVYATVDGARHWRLLPATLPEPATFSYLYALDVVTRRVGFALIGQPRPQGQRALLSTVDGGRSWTLIRPRLRRAETPTPSPSPSCGPGARRPGLSDGPSPRATARSAAACASDAAGSSRPSAGRGSPVSSPSISAGSETHSVSTDGHRIRSRTGASTRHPIVAA